MCVILQYLLKHPKPPPIHLKRCSPCTILPLPHSKSSPPRPPQHLAQPFAQMRYRCKFQVSSTGLNILEVCIIYLHVCVSQYMRFCRLSHMPRLRLACAFLKFHQNFRYSHTQSMDVEKDKTGYQGIHSPNQAMI